MVRIAFSCVLILLLPGVHAQTVKSGSWGSVQVLDVGQRIQVHSFGTDRVTGRFLSATPDSVVIRRGSGEVTIARADVQAVKTRRASTRLRNGAIGAAIGGGIAGGVTALAVREDFGSGDGLGAAITLVLALMGAGVGFVVGMIPPGYGSVYEATR